MQNPASMEEMRKLKIKIKNKKSREWPTSKEAKSEQDLGRTRPKQKEKNGFIEKVAERREFRLRRVCVLA